MPPEQVPATEPLHAAAARLNGLSLISYNMLLPNSGDGWWVYKYYDDTVPEAVRTWPHRHRLLKTQLLGEMADIVCLQEAREESLGEDLAFMADAGYGARLHRKGRMRCVTFFRTDRLRCLHERHTDKALALLLQLLDQPQQHLAVVNVHLNAAPAPRRRFRQVVDALDALRKDLKRHGIAPEGASVVVCGDFNARPQDSATDHFLRGGVVDAAHREPGWPDEVLSSRPRTSPLQSMQEAYQQALGRSPVTLFGGRLSAITPREGDPTPAALLDAIDRLFDRFASDDGVMDGAAVGAWITLINRAPDRGSEHRKAQALLASRPEGVLRREDLRALYLSELEEGKHWSIQHDLQVAGVLISEERELFLASLDRIYTTGDSVTLLGVWEPLSEGRRAQLMAERIGLPCAWHPSDHLPIGAVFSLRL
ncbi:MAG: endonuclease/exonuclease/phosphatase family metal-dependent hydrolase [Myxococcota bacterium]|jgi:endonuclease/exonuclease/phosphatase family metal-dependent hydrolase